ncbi:MAG: c-type cytochrome, partial [Planctomycetia bacterium]|nr:c-type cytochrome [Planctomycetia bacterium]
NSMTAGDTIPPPRPIPPAAEPGDGTGAMELFVVAGEGGVWKVQYPNGQRVIVGPAEKLTDDQRKRIGSLVLPVNRPVKFTCTTEKDAATFEIVAFPLAIEAKPGQYTRETVKPTRTGEFGIWYGSERVGSIVVLTAQEYDDWLQGTGPLPGEQPVDGSLGDKGRQLFLKLQCINCHSAKPDAKAPNLEGLWGSKVPFKGGGAEIADDQYIKESIRKPKAKVVDGWEPIMPAYDSEKVTAEELNALVAYIRSLKRGAKEDKFPPPVGAPVERPKLLEIAPPPREKPGGG